MNNQCQLHKRVSKIRDELHIARSSCLSINQVDPRPDHSLLKQFSGRLNIQRLKIRLRRRIPARYAERLLTPLADWVTEMVVSDVSTLGDSIWSGEELYAAVAEIVGRAYYLSRHSRKRLGESLRPEVVREVLELLGLYTAEKGPESLSEMVKSLSEEVDDLKRRVDRLPEKKDELYKIREKCNQYEKGLLSCLVDPEDLRMTWDDVIMDAETKESMKQLTSISKLNFDATSKFLKKLSIKGKLLTITTRHRNIH